MMSNSEKPAHGNSLERRLAAFDRRKDDLLAILQKVCGRTDKPFDEKGAWRHIRLYAWRHLEGAHAKAKPAADHVELLRELRNALSQARCKLNETRSRALVVLFDEWCKARGIPNFDDRHEPIFHEVLADLIAGLADLETAAFRAAEQVRQKPGRPRGTGVLQQDFIIALERTYRDITGTPGGAGPGPFAEFIKRFFDALGSARAEDSVIKAIQAAKQREEWGQSVLPGMGGKTPPNSP